MHETLKFNIEIRASPTNTTLQFPFLETLHM